MLKLKTLFTHLGDIEETLVAAANTAIATDAEQVIEIKGDEITTNSVNQLTMGLYKCETAVTLWPLSVTVMVKGRPRKFKLVRCTVTRSKFGLAGEAFDLFDCDGTIFDAEIWKLFFPEEIDSNLIEILDDATLGHNGINLKCNSHKGNKEIIDEINGGLRNYLSSMVRQKKGRSIYPIPGKKGDLTPHFLAIKVIKAEEVS